jgi:outer membrane protein, heavy metal efflux system
MREAASFLVGFLSPGSMIKTVKLLVPHVGGSVFSTLALVLCACVPYRPHNIDPVRDQEQFESRHLTDANLRAYVTKQMGDAASTTWPPERLSLPLLVAVAEYYSADLEVGRAQLAGFNAAIVSARQRVNPSLGANAGYSKNPESAATYGGSPAFTIETAGKRGYRILQAQQTAAAAQLAFSEADWQLRSQVRRSFVDYAFAVGRLRLLQQERAVRAAVEEIFAKRFASGEIAQPDFDAIRADRIAIDVALKQADGDVSQALATLAITVGLPAAALNPEAIDISSLDPPPGESSLPLLKVQKAGLLHRTDVQRMLAEYASADAALHLEVANQYPDIQLSPSYAFQEGFADYTLGIGLSALPIFHHNQGPIAEAEAQRALVEAKFKLVQTQAIGQMEGALRRYRSAFAEWRNAEDAFVAVQRARAVSVERAFQVGEADRLEFENAQLLLLAATRTRQDALLRVQTSLGALQDSVQQPLEDNLALPPVPLSNPRSEKHP